MSLADELAAKRAEQAAAFEGGVQWDKIGKYRQLDEEVLALERQVCAEAGEEYADEFPLLRYDIYMTPSVLVLGDDVRCAIVGRAREAGFCLFFPKIISYKLEGIKDEVAEGHRLEGKGLKMWRSFIVRNSSWRAEIQGIHRKQAVYEAARWESTNHYLIFFKNRIFETLALEPPQLYDYTSFAEALETATALFTELASRQKASAPSSGA